MTGLLRFGKDYPMSAQSNSSHGTTKITVSPNAISSRPISSRITGKFCEHLRDNILNGMSAQILRNPTFADYPIATGWMTPDGVIARHNTPETIEKEYRRMLSDQGWRKKDADSAVRGYFNGMAMWWLPFAVHGEEEYSPDTSYEAEGNRAQWVSSSKGEFGVSQWIYLPLHRVRRYQADAWVRGRDQNICARFVLSDASQIVAETELIHSDGIRFHGELTIPESLPEDAIYRFDLVMMSGAEAVVERVHLYPGDHVNFADPDVIRFLRESKLPLLRWPGGNFVSCYHWKDGVGPVEQRPTLPNYAWGGVEPNYFGTDDFIRYCRDIECEPMICVNVGNGTPKEAAEWLEYCNGDTSTPMGSLRAKYGHPEPYGVKLWEIGNEIWGRWQTHWTTASGYVERYHDFVQTMKQVDPSIEVMACGAPVLWGESWNTTLIGKAAEEIQCITDHPLVGGMVSRQDDPMDVYKDFMGVPSALSRRWRKLREEMESAGISDPRLAVTELQMFAHLPSKKDGEDERLGYANLTNPPSLGEALYDILVYHEAVRLSPFIEIITHSATVNHGGGLRKERERVYANPCHYAQSLFAMMHDATPLQTAIDTEVVRMPVVLGDVKSAGESGEYGKVDALAALSPSGELLLSIVNRSEAGSMQVDTDISAFRLEVVATLWILGSERPWDRNTLEQPAKIVPSEIRGTVREGMLSFELPAFSYVFVKIAC